MEDGGEDLVNRRETTDGTKSENTTGENLKQIRLKILFQNHLLQFEGSECRSDTCPQGLT